MNIEEFLNGKLEYDENMQAIKTIDIYGNTILIAEIRAWSKILSISKNASEAADFQDSVGKWIVEAMNEKLSR